MEPSTPSKKIRSFNHQKIKSYSDFFRDFITLKAILAHFKTLQYNCCFLTKVFKTQEKWRFNLKHYH